MRPPPDPSRRWTLGGAGLALAMTVGALPAIASAVEPAIEPPPIPSAPAPVPQPASVLQADATQTRLLLLLDLGWTGQVNQRSSGVGELVLIGLVEKSSNAIGLLGRLGGRGGELSWAVAMAGGRIFTPTRGGPWTILGELGLSALERKVLELNFSGEIRSTGRSILPHVGVRILRQLEPGGWWSSVGLFAQQTLGKTRSEATGTTSYLDGGFSIGLTAGWATPRNVASAPPDAAPR